MSETTSKRVDDGFMRRIIVTLTGIIVTQLIGWIFMLGSYINQVDNLETRMDKLESVYDTVIRMEVHMGAMANTLEKFNKTMDVVVLELERRKGLLNQVENYIATDPKRPK